MADDLALGDFDLWGFQDSVGAAVAYTVANPGRVSRLLLWDAYVRGSKVADVEAAASIIALVRSNWSLALRTFANLAFPTGPAELQHWLASQWRRSITPEVAVRYIEFLFQLDLSDYLPRITVPALVLHRRGDSSMPLAGSRAAAALIPGARFLTLEGDIAYAWLGDNSYLEHVRRFLDEGRPPSRAPQLEVANRDRLSEREIEVLRLLAQGKTNQEIAAALVISLNTVAHHVTNILNKAALSNRTEAAAYAYRNGIL